MPHTHRHEPRVRALSGGITAAQGGKFKNGFAAGTLSSLASSAFAFDGNTMDDTTLGWANSVRSSGLV